MMLPVIAFAQDAPQTKGQKKAAQKKEEQLRKQQLSEMKGKERQMEIQTKAVRKRMKKNKKQADRVNKSKGRPFWEKIFRKQRGQGK